jgi:hypothetical protein
MRRVKEIRPMLLHAFAKTGIPSKGNTVTLVIAIDVLENPTENKLLESLAISEGYDMIRIYSKRYKEQKGIDILPYPIYNHPESDEMLYCEVYFHSKTSPFLAIGEMHEVVGHRVTFANFQDFCQFHGMSMDTEYYRKGGVCWESFGKAKKDRIVDNAQITYLLQNCIGKIRVCKGCGMGGFGFKLCSGCKKVYYCGAACQKKDWRIKHKMDCKK